MALHRTGIASRALLSPYSQADNNAVLYLSYPNLLQVKLEVKNLAEFSKLAKYCKLTLLQEELDRAFNKANEFGERGTLSLQDYISVPLQC